MRTTIVVRFVYDASAASSDASGRGPDEVERSPPPFDSMSYTRRIKIVVRGAFPYQKNSFSRSRPKLRNFQRELKINTCSPVIKEINNFIFFNKENYTRSRRTSICISEQKFRFFENFQKRISILWKFRALLPKSHVSSLHWTSLTNCMAQQALVLRTRESCLCNADQNHKSGANGCSDAPGPWIWIHVAHAGLNIFVFSNYRSITHAWPWAQGRSPMGRGWCTGIRVQEKI
jgi:hypothetical protein